MVEDKKTTFPLLGTKSWWALRSKLQETTRLKVTDTFLASLLGVETRSARVNALRPYPK
jgi:hypothetical protein